VRERYVVVVALFALELWEKRPKVSNDEAGKMTTMITTTSWMSTRETE